MQDSTPFTFRYTLDKNLQRASYKFCRSVRLGSPIVRIGLAMVFLYGAGTLLLGAALLADDLLHGQPLTDLASMPIVSFLAIALVAHVVRSSLKQCQAFLDLGDISLTLTDDGVVYTSPTRSDLLSWLDIRGFKQNQTLFVLFTDSHYLPIPIQAIPDPQQAAAFINRSLTRHIHAAYPVLPPPLIAPAPHVQPAPLPEPHPQTPATPPPQTQDSPSTH